jgi:hypothetical protein
VENTLAARIARLEALLAEREPPRTATTIATPPAADGGTPLDRLAALADRLRAAGGELAQRSGADWDAGDRLTATLLLQDLAAAVAACREVAGLGAGELDAVEQAIAEMRRELP